MTPLRASRVPSSRLGRLFHYGGQKAKHLQRQFKSNLTPGIGSAGLAAGIGWGTASEALRRTATGQHDNTHPLTLSEANVRRLVDKLTKMRGAALKLGQFLAIQGCTELSCTLPLTASLIRRARPVCGEVCRCQGLAPTD
jgi:aarF domain-containing kinase